MPAFCNAFSTTQRIDLSSSTIQTVSDLIITEPPSVNKLKIWYCPAHYYIQLNRYVD